ncbi:hypothetical protein HMPREF3175_00610 [Arthrobacter sp. HMSC08H08]|nr:hypothetical protein HMPREF3175_00610 [Arthrobacter sp. HMSC08H08]
MTFSAVTVLWQFGFFYDRLRPLDPAVYLHRGASDSTPPVCAFRGGKKAGEISQCRRERVASDAGGVTPWSVWFVPVRSARGAGEAVPCEAPQRALTVRCMGVL